MRRTGSASVCGGAPRSSLQELGLLEGQSLLERVAQEIVQAQRAYRRVERLDEQPSRSIASSSAAAFALPETAARRFARAR